MSVVYCEGCSQHIDTDLNAEHFIEGTELHNYEAEGDFSGASEDEQWGGR